jgi:hypothetical protein
MFVHELQLAINIKKFTKIKKAKETLVSIYFQYWRFYVLNAAI